MAPSATVADSSPPSGPDITDNNLQSFFILHKVSSGKSDGKSSGRVKTRRRIDLSPSLHKTTEEAEIEKEEFDDCCHVESRTQAFEIVWSKIESTIKDVLRAINTNVFDQIHQWVRNSFSSIRSSGTPGLPEATRSFPLVTDATSKQLFTGLVLTKNVEFVDDLLSFQELGLHLKSQGCYVANLSSTDFSTKNGIGGCLRSLLRQLLMLTLDAADISILVSWYRENGNYDNPVVVIIDDMERCCGAVLSDMIHMLSECAVKIPVILILGIATTLDAPGNILRANALQHLCPHKFTLGTPAERMDAIVEAVLVKQCSGFTISHRVALFLRNYFINQDGTLTSFIRALKIACVQHFSAEPLSFILGQFLSEESNLLFLNEKYGEKLEVILKHAFNFPSCERNKMIKETGENLAHGLSELKKLQKHWSIVVLCLHQVGKFDKLRLLDLFCEALDPESYYSRASNAYSGLQKDSAISPSSVSWQKNHLGRNSSFICQALRRIRDLSASQLVKLVSRWENLTIDVAEIHSKVKELQCLLKHEDGTSSKPDMTNIPKRHASQSHSNIEKNLKAASQKAATLIECLLRDYMQPIECVTFHEIVCFKNVNGLQSALIGDPRRRIQVDLLEFHKILRCTCCIREGNVLLKSMHDTSIMYTLAQEHGDLINLHDWYRSFKSVLLSGSSKGKKKLKQSPLKKQKDINGSRNLSEAVIQAQFCRAVTELQITGLLRMPTKRRPDFVQRVAFGL